MVCSYLPKSNTRYSLLVCLILQLLLPLPCTFGRFKSAEDYEGLNGNMIGYGAPVVNEDDSIGLYDDSIEYDDPSVVEDSILTTPQLLMKYGYPAEVQHVTTEDGYILELHRIVNKTGVPVLLVHGLMDSSATWVMMGPKKGLAYLLHDLGYDVWMTNVRGNTYSRNHTVYRTSQAKFWDFSFHEMGKYDLPATIDHVLNATGHEQLHYIGHSQGTTVFWVMCSEYPNYSRKVLLMQALAPVAFVGHCKSTFVNFLNNLPILMLGSGEFLPRNGFMARSMSWFGKNEGVFSNFLFLITGFDKAQLNKTMIPVVLGHVPAGVSKKDIRHFSQLKSSGLFQQYEYSSYTNKRIYRTTQPPSYNLSNVAAKVALHYSQNDWLSTPEDVDHLDELLPNVVEKFLIDYKDFNHMDFVWGNDVRTMLYKKVVDLMHSVERGEL